MDNSLAVLRKKCFHYALQEKLCGELLGFWLGRDWSCIPLTLLLKQIQKSLSLAYELFFSLYGGIQQDSCNCTRHRSNLACPKGWVPCLSFYRLNLKCHCYQWPSWFRRSPQGTLNYTFCQQKHRYCSLSEQKCPTRKCHKKEFWSFAATTTTYIWPVPQLFIDRQTHSCSYEQGEN